MVWKIFYLKLTENISSSARKPTKPKAFIPELDPEYLEPLRHRRKQEGEMNAVIQDIIVYLCYLVIVVWVAEGPRHINSFYLKENLITTVIHGGLLCGRGEYDEPCDPKEDLPMWTNINVSRT